MAELFLIDEQWTEQPWFNTGGTRAKSYLQGPDNKFYYFKKSQLREGRDYTYEFWNEIIAYELGSMLGLNVLKYNIAIYKGSIGCMCESMINNEYEELIEGIKYLQAFSPSYDPTKKEHQTWYTFDLIENALDAANIKYLIDDIINIIVFDSIIGNGDRHQENWAVISKQRLLTEIIKEIESTGKIKFTDKNKLVFYSLAKEVANYQFKGKEIPKSFYQTDIRFSPIYDSGSSLGRELLTEKVEKFLESQQDLNRYISKGTSEIHWDNKKVSHFQLIRNLLESKHSKKTRKIIQTCLECFEPAKFDKVIAEIDVNVPENYLKYKIPFNRKQLIIKIITLRLESLRGILHERF